MCPNSILSVRLNVLLLHTLPRRHHGMRSDLRGRGFKRRRYSLSDCDHASGNVSVTSGFNPVRVTVRDGSARTAAIGVINLINRRLPPIRVADLTGQIARPLISARHQELRADLLKVVLVDRGAAAVTVAAKTVDDHTVAGASASWCSSSRSSPCADPAATVAAAVRISVGRQH